GVTLDSAPSLTTGAGAGAPTQALPARRGDLVIRSTGDNGQHVVKDPQTGEFFDLGPEESFLLLGLDGRQTTADLSAAFEARFGSPLSPDDVQDFLGLARAYFFLPAEAPSGAAPPARPSRPVRWTSIL